MRVLTTGMGCEAAAGAAATALGGRMVAVVVAGVAGGCDPTLAVGTVVVATGLCDLSGRPLDAPPVDPEVSAAVLAAAAPAVAGTVASGDAVVDDAAGRARLAAAGALAVETEAAGWAPACLRAAVPLVVVRAVLDTPHRPLAAAAGLVRQGATAPSAWRLAWLGSRPAAWTTLAHLARAAPGVEARAAGAAVAAARALRDRG
jgi:4-hydroxy-3-methylbut-2-en-1-yl diphosphate reductase